MPLMINDSCVTSISTCIRFESVVGFSKRPDSRRLYQIQKPCPSQPNSFNRDQPAVGARSPVDKDEPMPGCGILLQHRLGEQAQAAKASPHIDRFEEQKHACLMREVQHASCSFRTWRISRSQCASHWQGTMIRHPSGNTTSQPVGLTAGGVGSSKGTNVTVHALKIASELF